MATWDDVRRLALAMPGAVERTSRGPAQWTVGGRFFAWERPRRRSDLEALGAAAPDGPVLGARVEHLAAKEAVLAEGPPFFTTPHFDGHPVVLVELDRISEQALEEVVAEAWLTRASPREARAWLDARR